MWHPLKYLPHTLYTSLKGQSKMANPKKLQTQVTQEEEKQKT
jgi:hypothetical protein